MVIKICLCIVCSIRLFSCSSAKYRSIYFILITVFLYLARVSTPLCLYIISESMFASSLFSLWTLDFACETSDFRRSRSYLVPPTLVQLVTVLEQEFTEKNNGFIIWFKHVTQTFRRWNYFRSQMLVRHGILLLFEKDASSSLCLMNDLPTDFYLAMQKESQTYYCINKKYLFIKIGFNKSVK